MARASGKKKAATKRVDGDDVYGASGGMPFAQSSQTVLGDRSGAKRATQELSWAEFDRQVQLLARKAAAFKAEAVVGIAHGGVFVGGAIASALKAEFFPVRLTRRSRDTRAGARLTDELPEELKGRRVLVVDDISSSGDSLELASRLARAAGATKVKTAALVTRPKGHAPDYSAYVTDTFFVFPWDYQAVAEDERFETRKTKAAKSSKKRGAPKPSGSDDVVLGV